MNNANQSINRLLDLLLSKKMIDFEQSKVLGQELLFLNIHQRESQLLSCLYRHGLTCFPALSLNPNGMYLVLNSNNIGVLFLEDGKWAVQFDFEAAPTRVDVQNPPGLVIQIQPICEKERFPELSALPFNQALRKILLGETKLVTLFVLLWVIDSAVEIAQPILYQHALDHLIKTGDFNAVKSNIVAAVVIIFFGFINSLSFQNLFTQFANRIEQKLTDYFFVRQSRRIWSTLNSIGPDKIRANFDLLGQFRLLAANPIFSGIASVPMLIAYLLAISYYAPLAGLIGLGLAAVLALVSAWLMNVRDLAIQNTTDMNMNTEARFEQIASSVPIIQAYGISKKLFSNWVKQDAVQIGRLVKLDRKTALIKNGTDFLVTSYAVGCAIYGAFLIQSSGLQVGQMIALCYFAGNLIVPAQKLTELAIGIQGFRTIIQQIEATLPSTNIAEDPTILTSAAVQISTLELQNVELRDPVSGRQILKNISFKVDVNTGPYWLGLAGPSGSGKSSLLKVLTGELEPNHGRVLVNGRDIFKLSSAERAALIDFVSQSTALYSASIEDNISRSIIQRDRQRTLHAINAVNLQGVLNSLPEGEDTSIDQSFGALSGGERQRLGLARVFYNHRPLILLDESTANLDSITESYVLDSLQNLRSTSLYVFVSHRWEALVRCNRILVLQDGQIVEDGSPKNLLAKNGVFSQLFQDRTAA